jgi:lipopolysaccharide transport system ATP-binding protein
MKLKNFSSGMAVRLAFATAVQTDPDILLVDEVLAVGDEAFQRRCGEKIEDIRREGKTIVVVSHALGTVQELCERCILLKNGRVLSSGETEKVVEEYLRVSAAGAHM